MDLHFSEKHYPFHHIGSKRCSYKINIASQFTVLQLSVLVQACCWSVFNSQFAFSAKQSTKDEPYCQGVHWVILGKTKRFKTKQFNVLFHRFRRLNQLHCLFSCACAPCGQLQHGWIFLVKANELWTWTCLLWYRESEDTVKHQGGQIHPSIHPENRKLHSYSGCLSQDHSTRS